MAVVSSLGITFNTNAGNKTVVAVPAIDDLIVIVCANTGRTTGQFPTVTDNNSSGVYERLALNPTKASSADSMWIFVRTRLVPAASSTTFTMTQTGDSGGGLQVFKVTNMNIVGAGAIRGAGEQDNQSTGTTPAPVLLRRIGTSFSGTQVALTANSLISAVFNATSPAGTTPRSSPAWTGSGNGGYSTPTAGLRTAFINTGETASTLTWGPIHIKIVTSIRSYNPSMWLR
jgi:hypothetical protein